MESCGWCSWRCSLPRAVVTAAASLTPRRSLHPLTVTACAECSSIGATYPPRWKALQSVFQPFEGVGAPSGWTKEGNQKRCPKEQRHAEHCAYGIRPTGLHQTHILIIKVYAALRLAAHEDTEGRGLCLAMGNTPSGLLRRARAEV
jgi:hypothetical protein